MRKLLLTATEFGTLTYWVFAAMLVANWIYVPPELMYSDYQNSTIVAWNWSFMPLDVLFAVLGLISRFGRLSPGAAGTVATISLSLMFCAGLMAVSFWVIRGEFDPFWWVINLWLMGLAGVLLMREVIRT